MVRVGHTARQVALDVLARIDDDGAYANLALDGALNDSKLSPQDRRFVTDLVYGTTRMRRACDAVIDAFVTTDPDPATRRLLRLGAYQLLFGGVAPHAAVSATVDLAPKRTRGFVNAILRRVSEVASGERSVQSPSRFAALSYPDWLGSLLVDELGADDAVAAMETMNLPAPVTVRDDGYVQDASSQWVAAAVPCEPGDRVADVCAAPGGKATALAAKGATVVASDINPARVGLIVDNDRRLDSGLIVCVADASMPPFPDDSFDAVLLDAPCSGLGALRRRPDARWRIQPGDVDDLAALQRRLLASAATLVRPGGTLTYSVCTLTAAESIDHPTPDGFDIDTTPPPVGQWRPFGHGWRVLPQDADTDGMVLIRYRRSS